MGFSYSHRSCKEKGTPKMGIIRNITNNSSVYFPRCLKASSQTASLLKYLKRKAICIAISFDCFCLYAKVLWVINLRLTNKCLSFGY